MNRFDKVVLNSPAEALECAIALVDKEYNHLNPYFEDDHVHIFIDHENKEFDLTNEAGMRIKEMVVKYRDQKTVNQINLNDIVKWQNNQKIKA